ncbi:MAG: hypothetical protein K0Q64_649 [Nitrobacter vulgaris]|nr:hypothetical protein [Nitrobacter vulgaris]
MRVFNWLGSNRSGPKTQLFNAIAPPDFSGCPTGIDLHLVPSPPRPAACRQFTQFLAEHIVSAALILFEVFDQPIDLAMIAALFDLLFQQLA